MRNLTKATLPVAMTAALAFALTPNAAHAQSAKASATPASAQQACTAQVTPASLEAGQKAVQVQVKLSEKVGTISSVEGDAVQLASVADLPKAEMSRSEKGEKDEAPKVVQMAAEGNAATLWLNTTEAKAGTEHLTLKGEQGSCTAQVKVAGGGMKKEQKH